MTPGLRLSQLSVQRQHLVRLCQSTNYGYIENLLVRGRQPVIEESMPLVMVDLKLDSKEGLLPKLEIEDFTLSQEVTRLMRLLDDIEDGAISKIEVRDGIPRRVIVECRAARVLSR